MIRRISQARLSPREPGMRRGIVQAGVFTTVLVAQFAWTPGAAAQPDKQEQVEFQATVLDLSERYQRIAVPLNRSATIETTVEMARADVIAGYVADVQVLSPTRLLITGKNFGNTSIVLTASDGRQHVFDIRVELDIETLNDTLRAIDPLSTARASAVNGNIVLSGTVSTLDRVQRMIDVASLFLPPAGDRPSPAGVQNHLEVAGEQQVMIKVVVAEVSRAASRELGVNGFLAGDDFKDAFLLNQLGGINPINIGAAGSALADQTIPFFTNEDGIPVTLSPTISVGFPRVQGQVFIKAMADNNLMRILAEPNLVAISGETATFLAGGEFPVPVPQGLDRITIEWKQFGVQLDFTPVVRGNQLIRLRVAPEVSELDFTAAVQFQGSVIPGVSARSAESTVELGNGQTIALAGLLNEQVRGVASRVPGLGDVPILGALFRSVEYQRSLTELVILVTPELVSPLEPHQKVRVPGEELTDPNDFELYALGLLERRGTTILDREGPEPIASDPDRLSFHGPWGPAEELD
jgi:pilus assembly protein CpaC